ncbi:MAG: UvrD-helicase domain-containing protein [Bacteroidota bacterium]
MTISISQDFLEAFSNLPRAQQKKARAFIEKFRENPTSPGINYETINGASDPNLRSVRIDQTYRGIVLKPDSGDVYVLLWVDHHDDAYQWAANKRVAVHPDTGVLQIVPASENDAPTLAQEDSPEPKAPAREGLFRDLRDRDLLRFGLPDVLIPVVRNVGTDEDLDRLAPHLPEEAGEALYMIAAGYSLEEVDREFAWRASQEPVDTDDFAAALRRPDSQRRFATVDGEEELAEMLNAPLKHWRVFLHPSQRSLVTINANGPVRVLGGAGTGKTVVAMHRARWLVENVLAGVREQVLFTTFTRNLAADISANLALLCPTEVLARIEVTHLDGWLSGYLRTQSYVYDIDYTGTRTRPLWEEATAKAPEGVSASFLRDEWEDTIVPQEVESLTDYLRAARRGRGTPLSRRDRKALWPVFEEYRTLLDEHHLREPALAMQDARALLQYDDVLPYRCIVVDEAQDFGASAFRLLRAMVPPAPHDLFIVGDAHQRIYASPVVLGHCGIDIVGRGRKLRVNYRTTEQTRRWAVALLDGVPVDDLDGGQDSQRGYRSLVQGTTPTVTPYDSFAAEVEAIVDFTRALNPAKLASTCLVARTGRLVSQYEGALRARGVDTHLVETDQAEDRSAPGLRLATMHRVKGLEFDRVLIVAVNDDVVPNPIALTGPADDAGRASAEARERALLHVAATRARRSVTVSSNAAPSRFL